MIDVVFKFGSEGKGRPEKCEWEGGRVKGMKVFFFFFFKLEQQGSCLLENRLFEIEIKERLHLFILTKSVL